MRLLSRILTLGASLIVMHSASFSAESAVTERVGSTSVSLPTPPGFTEASGPAPGFRRLGETMTPPTNRLLAVFLSDGDIVRAAAGKPPELIRYFMVQTLRHTEGMVLTPADFAQVRDLLRTQYKELLHRAKPGFQGELDRMAGEFGKQAGASDLSLKLGEMTALEVFDDRPQSISLLALTKYVVHAAGKTEEAPVAMSMTTAILKGKVVYLYAYSRYRSAADIEWVRSEMSAWSARVQGAN
jgi:hypothetical protein